MELSIDLTDLILPEDEEVLINVLGCESRDELSDTLKGICLASMSEYLEMLLGKQVPTRANEIMERRLFHLLKHHFSGRIPSESEISSVFQLTESQSRSLLRNVRTRFKFDLEEEMSSTIRGILRTASEHEGYYRVVIQSDNILEELKLTVSLRGPKLNQITKMKNSAGVHNIPEDTFALLCSKYDVRLEDLESAATEE